jgi:hypothetical protein
MPRQPSLFLSSIFSLFDVSGPYDKKKKYGRSDGQHILHYDNGWMDGCVDGWMDGWMDGLGKND